MAQIIDKEVLNEFYKLEGEDFVHAIYGRILCRNADEGGLAAHIGALKAGTTKETLIFNMVASHEALAKNVMIRDFRVKAVPFEQLLSISDDWEFIRASFIAILGSDMDAKAMEDYGNGLLSGIIDRLDIVLSLMDSDKAKTVGTDISGLSKYRKRRRIRNAIFRIPVLGKSLKSFIRLRQLCQMFAGAMFQAEQWRRDMRRELFDAQQLLRAAQNSNADLERRFNNLVSRLDGMNAKLTSVAIRQRQINEPTTGVLYKKYEDEMRGSRELIIERLKIYDSVFRNVKAANGDRICALDLGCGRGEWLELAQNTYGVHAVGVDSDASMLSDCAKNGLTAIQGDLVEYIKGAEGDSVDIVTMFQVAEHLPVSILNEVLNECHRVLRKGGALIVETPNPENMIVGACNFHFDPTHVSKLPPPLLKILVESSGMSRAEIVRMHRYGAIDIDKDGDADTAATKQLAAFFNNFADYAVIAYKE